MFLCGYQEKMNAGYETNFSGTIDSSLYVPFISYTRRRRRRAHDASQEMCGRLAGLVCVCVCFEFVMLDLLFFLSFYICPPNGTDGFPLFSREIDPLDFFFNFPPRHISNSNSN